MRKGEGRAKLPRSMRPLRNARVNSPARQKGEERRVRRLCPHDQAIREQRKRRDREGCSEVSDHNFFNAFLVGKEGGKGNAQGTNLFCLLIFAVVGARNGSTKEKKKKRGKEGGTRHRASIGAARRSTRTFPRDQKGGGESQQTIVFQQVILAFTI